MGAEDGEVPGFRIWSDLFFIEVLDPQTHEPLPEGKVGPLVVTPLFTNHVAPFLRWMSGDLVSRETEVRGRSPYAVFPIVRHAERTTGFFKIKGINIGHGEFEDLLFRQRAINDFKCKALTVKSQDVLRVFVELKRDCDARAAMDHLANAIRATFELTPEIVPIELGTLTKEFEASIKAARIVDRRANSNSELNEGGCGR
jgi:phenylacetate-CoA ligase